MPTYEYVCKRCGHLFEIVQSMKDDPLTECPECGGELRKVFAPPAISFKGSGFYATDHGKKKSTSSGAEKKKDAPTTGKKTDTKGSGGSSSETPGGNSSRGDGSGGSSGGAKDGS
jgi:putative FmdB family regulatory protein